MLIRYSDFDQGPSPFDEFRRQMVRLFEGFDQGSLPGGHASAVWPRVNVFDNGSTLVLQADVPGLTEKDVQLQLTNDVLTLLGERKIAAPEGYTAHRRERGAFKLARSFSLPCKVDAEKCTATVKDGVLTVTLAKTPEAQPRKIAVKGS